jgi:hypothetical protein
MNLMDYIIFAGKSFAFSGIALLISLLLGWVLYNKIIIGKHSLKDALFNHDNNAAWIEFMGAFIFPVLYVVSVSIRGSESNSYLQDLLKCSIYAVLSVVLLVVLHTVSGTFVSMLKIKDSKGKVTLTNEIYDQKNTAAALFSVGLSAVFANIVAIFDIHPDFMLSSTIKVGVVLMATLAALTVYGFELGKKTSLIKELFINNNPASGIGFLGFVLAIQYILSSVVHTQTELNLKELLIMTVICLIVFGVIAYIIKWLFTKLIKVDMWSEMFEQNNIGAAIGQAVVYIGTALAVVSYIS